jgi:cAMP-specific phosphodiesterase 4
MRRNSVGFSIESDHLGQGDDDVKLLTGMIVHTADFNGGAKVFEVSRIWSERVNIEFSAQYEQEG